MTDQATRSTETTSAQATGASLHERAAQVSTALHRRASFTEIMRKTLEFCSAERTYSAVEAEMTTYPEFQYSDQSQASIIEILVLVGGLEKKEIDKAGNVISASQKAGLSLDQIDDLVWSFSLKTTDAGLEAIKDLDPNKKLATLFDSMPERVEVYKSLLNLCRKPTTFKQVEEALKDMPKLTSLNDLSTLPVHPSALLAELEEAGGLVFNEAWCLTEAGATFA